ncbi:hypothetical protein PMI36_01729 [Pseudomonas sp. GM79]|nr:hypothetical protein PMI36_01729 [Pseudomonas sp. GM79]
MVSAMEGAYHIESCEQSESAKAFNHNARVLCPIRLSDQISFLRAI